MTTDPTDLRQRITDIATPFFANFSDEESARLNAGELADALAAVPPPADRAAVLAEVLPDWEAVYEPGNVSDYLIGYANDQDAATGMAEAWMRSQAEVTGRLEWVSEERLATGRYDRWFELIERHDDGIDTGPGIVVRRRLADEAQQPDTEDGGEQADGPTWSDTCPHCKRWYTTSEPGAHEAACPMRPGAEAPQPEPDETDASEADIDGMLAVGVPVQVVTRPPDTHAAPEPEPSVHGESVAHLAGLHNDARQDGAQQ